jgi:hypothetical protein
MSNPSTQISDAKICDFGNKFEAAYDFHAAFYWEYWPSFSIDLIINPLILLL